MNRAVVVVFAVLATAVCAQDIRLFDYDHTAKLDVREGASSVVNRAHVSDLSYASPRGGRVPAYLVMPAGRGPFPGIVFVHWGQGNRSEFLSEAVGLAKSGIASILIDAPTNRVDRPNNAGTPESERDSLIQLVVDARRAVDVLVSRTEIDARRLAYVGHSLGATWGGALAACERRFKALVLMGGLPEISEVKPPDPLYQKILQAVPTERAEANRKALRPIDPVQFVGQAAPAHVFFQWAKVDRFVSEEAAKRYFAAASQPKSEQWYYCGHEFNATQATLDRERFLKEQLKR